MGARIAISTCRSFHGVRRELLLEVLETQTTRLIVMIENLFLQNPFHRAVKICPF